jgi:hypothetical protein
MMSAMGHYGHFGVVHNPRVEGIESPYTPGSHHRVTILILAIGAVGYANHL